MNWLVTTKMQNKDTPGGNSRQKPGSKQELWVGVFIIAATHAVSGSEENFKKHGIVCNPTG